jgi:hypothetical protein
MQKNTMRGRPRNAPMCEVTRRELSKFFSFYKSYRAAAEAIGVSSTSACGWASYKFKPSAENARKMQEVTNGAIDARKIIYGEDGAPTAEKTFYDYMIHHHIEPKAEQLGKTVEQFLADCVPPIIEEIMLKSHPSDEDCKTLAVILGGSIFQWLSAKEYFK